MPNVFATTVIPEDLLWLGWGREPVPGGTAGVPTAPVMTMPFAKGNSVPDDKPTMLMDDNVRGFMGKDYNQLLGTEIADFPVSGDVYLQSIGYPLHNLFGDYITTGTNPTTSWTPSAAITQGASAIAVTAGAVAAQGTFVQITAAGNTTSEVCVVGSGSTTTNIVLAANTPTKYSYTSSATVKLVTAPFTHKFALLNGAGLNGQNIDAQPPTHTITWYNNLAASTLARQYAYWCASAIDFKLNSDGLFQHDTKGTSLLGIIAPSAVTNTQDPSLATADWNFKVTIGGTTMNNVTDATVSYARDLKPDFGLNGQQAPYVIARLGMSASGKLTFIAQDETPLTTMLNGTQQALVISMSLGAGVNQTGVTFTFTKAQYKTTQVQVPDVLMYDVEFTGLMNNTDVGGTGGLGFGTVSIINGIPTY